MLELTSNNVMYLENESDELINDKDFMLEAIKINNNAIYYIGKDLLNDQNIINL